MEQQPRKGYYTTVGVVYVQDPEDLKKGRGICPYSPDIRWEKIGPGVVLFTGTGILRGEMWSDEDSTSYRNCLGELTCRYMEWDSSFYTLVGDYFEPNTWLKEVHIGPDIQEADIEAFRECAALRKVVIYNEKTRVCLPEGARLLIAAPEDFPPARQPDEPESAE